MGFISFFMVGELSFYCFNWFVTFAVVLLGVLLVLMAFRIGIWWWVDHNCYLTLFVLVLFGGSWLGLFCCFTA